MLDGVDEGATEEAEGAGELMVIKVDCAAEVEATGVRLGEEETGT